MNFDDWLYLGTFESNFVENSEEIACKIHELATYNCISELIADPTNAENIRYVITLIIPLKFNL